MPIPFTQKLYRGLGGLADLPEMSRESVDGEGFKGFLEWGVVSATSRQDLALKYFGLHQGKPKAMVMEIKVTAANVPAFLGPFSQ